MPRRSAARSERQRVVSDPSDTPQAAETPAEAPREAQSREGGIYYTVRQHIGFVLGFLSVFLSYWTFEEDDPRTVTKLMACLALGLVGLVFHELRPFKRQSYGDVWWERFVRELNSRPVDPRQPVHGRR